ncbi:hypothetical protein CYLTODRAFT_217505 [Cylindrobasidium torrendii FP15055 ss-10]|uniref:CASTOR ACT domain-containing protein n=1 Tax=Cylindrobasidium torrendii FP15055 ss-10 TaxID=1314674 RepID=A0A0D7BSV6_9AGAR|nr:hypothetical protein CYLTODRAFT_217505 [Cylindrobasidium torrendii FP15055 ss-10]
MPPPSAHPCLNLLLQENDFFVVKEPKIEPWLLEALSGTGGTFFSVTRTPEEISIAGEVYEGMPKQFEEHSGWRCIKIAGPMEFELTGVLCSLTIPLMSAGVPIFAISTWNTDWVLVPKAKIGQAQKALSEDGWKFQ